MTQQRTARNWTDRQVAVFDFVKNPNNRNGVVEAVAGGAKTTTGLESAKLTRGSAIWLAYNGAIVKDVKPRAPRGVEVRTINSLGHYICQRHSRGDLIVDDLKTYRIADAHFPPLREGNESQGIRRMPHPAVRSAPALMSLVKNTLTDPSDESALLELIDRYDIDVDEEAVDDLLAAMPDLIATDADMTRTIDYDDQWWLPVVNGWSGLHYDWVFGDEVQDWSLGMIAFVEMVARYGRAIGFGDRYQSIYGFRGADMNAVPNLIQRLTAATLPLDTTFRCPVSHVELAQRIVPHIQAAPGAIQGDLFIKNLAQMVEERDFQPGELVVCSTNKPLIKLAYRLINRNVPVRVRGRHIGTGLIELLDKIWDGADDVERLLASIERYFEAESEKVKARHERAAAHSGGQAEQGADDPKLRQLQDRCETLAALADGAEHVWHIKDRIRQLFSDEDDARYVTLCTVHGSKGLEATRVTIIAPEQLDKVERKDWLQQQARNKRYVAYTRSKLALTFAEGTLE